MQATSWRLPCYVFLWYGFTLLYNISNKQLLNEFPYPVTCASLQLLCCIPFVLPMWMYSPPLVDTCTYRPIFLISLFHGLGSLAAVIGVAAGSVAFAQATRGAEPIFCAIISLLILRARYSIFTYFSLVVIVVGVCMVSLQEIDFSWCSFLSALACGVLYQLRSVLAKVQLAGDKDKPLWSPSLSGAQLFRVISVVSCIQMFPVALLTEASSMMLFLQLRSSAERFVILYRLLLSGSAFYIYNEVAFWILELMSPVTHSITNALKRVVIIIISCLIFGTSMTYLAMLGVAITAIGTAIYSNIA